MPLSCNATISLNRVAFFLSKYSLRQDQQQRKDDETTNDDTNDIIFHFYTLYAISIDISDDDDAILEMKNWSEHDINSNFVKRFLLGSPIHFESKQQFVDDANGEF